MSNIITLRNVFGKVKEVHFQPCKQANGSPFPFVKPVRYDAFGNAEMLMSDAERNSPESAYFIAEDADIVVTDGTTFDLDDPLQKNIWESIKNSDLIVPTRDARDANGNLYIDGNKERYGLAEFYVDIPGVESSKNVSKKQKITKAWTFIGNDSQSGRLTKCKILGKYMENAVPSDVEDYLYQMAERNPDQIIELYTSGDMALKLLLIDAKQKAVILKKDGMYMYGDAVLGATDDAVLLFFKMPTNKRVLDQIKFQTYPEYAPITELENKINFTEQVPEEIEGVPNEITEKSQVESTKKK